MALTPQQKRFVEEYLNLRLANATEAARRANYSEKGASVQACRLLKLPEIQAAIKERTDQVAMSADEVLLRLADHARGNIEDFIDIGPDEPLAELLREEIEDVQKFVKDTASRKTRTSSKSREVEDEEIEGDESEVPVEIRAAAKEQLRRLKRALHDAERNEPRPNLLKALKRGSLHLIKKLEVQGVKIELYGAQTALETLGRAHQLFVERLDVRNLTEEQIIAYLEKGVRGGSAATGPADPPDDEV